ncbi:MAG TPA: hypothetical protein VJ596_04615 [Gemmatimonadaceae bacterium]|nr:hypothetical protein [Gemmatimonadaceae bacterium]
MNAIRKRYESPVVLWCGTVESETRVNLVWAIEPDMTGQYPTGNVGFGV